MLTMKLLVIVAAVVAYTSTSPLPELLHPSPVNPHVLVAVKPEEKIILITDPKEIAKFKRETGLPFYPTVLPNEHHVKKREHDVSHKVNTQEKTTEKGCHVEIKQDHSENRKALQPEILLSKEFTDSTAPQKRDIPVPLVPKHHHPEESPKESSEIESNADKKLESHERDGVKSSSEQQQHKRDIPVPLVPKYHHPEESPKDSSEQENDKTVSSENKQTASTLKPKPVVPNANTSTSNGASNENDKKSTTQNENLSSADSAKPLAGHKEHHLARPHPVPVAELFAKNPAN